MTDDPGIVVRWKSVGWADAILAAIVRESAGG